MAFGKNRNTQVEDSETHISNTPNYVEVEDELVVEEQAASASQSQIQSHTAEKDNSKPLLDEVTFIGVGKLNFISIFMSKISAQFCLI